MELFHGGHILLHPNIYSVFFWSWGRGEEVREEGGERDLQDKRCDRWKHGVVMGVVMEGTQGRRT